MYWEKKNLIKLAFMNKIYESLWYQKRNSDKFYSSITFFTTYHLLLLQTGFLLFLI